MANLTALKVTDRDLVLGYFSRYPVELWCAYFPYLICFGNARRHIVYEERKGCLCVYALAQSKDGRFLNLIFPPVGEKSQDVILECIDLMREYNPNGTWRIMWLEEKDAKSLESQTECIIKDKGVEYFYRPSDFSELSGGKFESLRKATRRFAREFEVEFVPYSSEYQQECLRMLDEWEATQGMNYFKLLDSDYTRQAIFRYSQFDQEDLSGEVAIIEGEVKGFSFGGRMNPYLANAFILKADVQCRGLSHVMKLRQITSFSGIELVADAGDLGSGGLRQFKRSFAPAKIIPTFSAGNAPKNRKR